MNQTTTKGWKCHFYKFYTFFNDISHCMTSFEMFLNKRASMSEFVFKLFGHVILYTSWLRISLWIVRFRFDKICLSFCVMYTCIIWIEFLWVYNINLTYSMPLYWILDNVFQRISSNSSVEFFLFSMSWHIRFSNVSLALARTKSFG